MLESNRKIPLPDAERKEVATRISRALGHLRHVRQMVVDERDCPEVLIQISAVNGALGSVSKELIGKYLDACVQDIQAHGDTGQLETLKELLKRFAK